MEHVHRAVLRRDGRIGGGQVRRRAPVEPAVLQRDDDRSREDAGAGNSLECVLQGAAAPLRPRARAAGGGHALAARALQRRVRRAGCRHDVLPPADRVLRVARPARSRHGRDPPGDVQLRAARILAGALRRRRPEPDLDLHVPRSGPRAAAGALPRSGQPRGPARRLDRAARHRDPGRRRVHHRQGPVQHLQQVEHGARHRAPGRAAQLARGGDPARRRRDRALRERGGRPAGRGGPADLLLALRRPRPQQRSHHRRHRQRAGAAGRQGDAPQPGRALHGPHRPGRLVAAGWNPRRGLRARGARRRAAAHDRAARGGGAARDRLHRQRHHRSAASRCATAARSPSASRSSWSASVRRSRR